MPSTSDTVQVSPLRIVSALTTTCSLGEASYWMIAISSQPLRAGSGAVIRIGRLPPEPYSAQAAAAAALTSVAFTSTNAT